MAVFGNVKKIGIHIARGLAYVTFPMGIFLFSLFILSASQHALDFSTFGNVLLNILAFLFFFIPPTVILFLHPLPKQNANTGIKRYLPHLVIILVLAIIALVPFLYELLFITAIGYGGI